MIKSPLVLFFKLFIAALPLLLLITFYFIDDPFRVLYVHETYYKEKMQEMYYNRDHISTSLYKSNYPKFHYDSFIFGSSRAYAFYAKEWQKYISSPAFHFDAGSESLYGIYTKIKYICENNRPLKNCLLIMDSTTFSRTTNDVTLNQMKDPETSGESRFKYQYKFFSAFLSGGFFVSYAAWKSGNTAYQIFDFPPIINGWYFSTDITTNDVIYTEQEKIISENKEYYYKSVKLFYEKDTVKEHVIPIIIGNEQKKLLGEMKNYFVKSGTSYKIVLCPEYSAVRFNPEDVKTLITIFGKDNVYDYSGLNDISKHKENFIDLIHIRSIAANKIMDEIYGKVKQDVNK